MAEKRVKVLVVEDSQVVLDLLVYILEGDPEIEVVGTARTGEEAIRFLERKQPDVITMDIHMPKMDGLQATRQIMETRPTAVVIVSGSTDPKEVETSFQAMEAGAVATLPRPNGIGHAEHHANAKELRETIKSMAEVKLVRRWPRLKQDRKRTVLTHREIHSRSKIKLVAIGASTGGPVVLQTILSKLPKDFSVPLVIVQHIAAGFVTGFVEWLSQSAEFPVHLATQGEFLLPGHAYIAPDGFHTCVRPDNRLALVHSEPEHGMRPSVSVLFRSTAEAYGSNAIGVLLSGMGKDGAAELKLMKDSGAITMAQDKESSVVHGMPGEAKALDAVTHVLAPEAIAAALKDLVQENRFIPKKTQLPLP